MSTIEIDNVAAIAHAEINIPDEGGGVLLLRGGNGVGKTTAIDIIQALITKRGKLIPRDMADVGKVEGLGGKIRVGGTTTRTGDVEVPTLEGRFDFADLVAPPLKDAEARAAKRIQALIGLTGVKPNIEAFYGVVGGKERMDALLTPKEQATADLVDLAAKIKRAVESEATKVEGRVESAQANARAAKAAAEGVDLSKPADAAELQDALVAAVGRVRGLKQQRETWAAAEERAMDARSKLAAFESTTTPMIDVQAEVEAKRVAKVAARDRVEELREMLEVAEAALETAVAAHAAAERVLESAKRNQAAVDGWRQQIEAVAQLPNPPESEIVAAEQAAASAREAVDDGAQVRNARQKLADAERFDADAKSLGKQAAALREQAGSVYGVLSKQIPAGPLYVVGGQLVVDTEDRKAEPFDRLSDGERWRLAIPYAVEAVGAGGILCVPQDAWQHLSPSARSLVARECHKANVWLISGEATDGELRSEVFKPDA